MPRYTFGGEAVHVPVSEDATNVGTTNPPRKAIAFAPGVVTIPFYLSPGGTLANDFRLFNSSTGAYDIPATSISSLADGFPPAFQGPNDVRVLYDAAGKAYPCWEGTAAGTTTAGTVTSVNTKQPTNGNVTVTADDIADGQSKVMMTAAERQALQQAANAAGVSVESMTAALQAANLNLQGQFLNALGADDTATRALFATILGFVPSPTVGKLIYNRDYTAATAATVTRPNGTDTTKTIVRWRATDGTTTLPAAYIAGNDEQRIVRQA